MTHYVSRTASGSPNNWMTYIAGGSMDDIELDNDGVMPDTRILIDLSHAMSEVLGKQMSQMANYRVSYISVNIVNRQDGIDNESGVEFSGQLNYYSPTQNRIDALQLARQLEKHTESADIDADSFLLTTEKDYSGMRFNWDGDNQIKYPTVEGFSALVGSEWDITELFSIYNTMLGSGDYANELWTYGRCGRTENISFNTWYQNKTGTADALDDHEWYEPRSHMFQANVDFTAMTGLLVLDITNSSTDDPTTELDWDDDWRVEVTIGVDGWSGF